MAQPTSQSSQRPTNNVADHFNASAATEAANLYAPQAVWGLSNGKTLVGRPAIHAFLEMAIEGGAKGMTLDQTNTQPLRQGIFETATFSFVLGNGTKVEGKRFTHRHEGLITSDVWVPRGPSQESPELDEAMRQYDASFNSADPQRMRSIFATEASMVLSDASFVPQNALDTFITKTAAMKIDTMQTSNPKHQVFGDFAISEADFSVTIPGDTPVHLSGGRLLLWKREHGAWKVAHEASWPKK